MRPRSVLGRVVAVVVMLLVVGAGIVLLVSSGSTDSTEATTSTRPVGPTAATSDTGTSGASSAVPAPRFFAKDSVWNQPIPAGAELDPRSASWSRQVLQQVSTGYAPTINANTFTSAIATVPRGQPKVRVTLDKPNPTLQRQFDAVPVPDDARISPGTDQHLTVYQPSTDTLWEFWKTRHQGEQWFATYGGRIEHVSRNPGYFDGDDSLLGATATGLPLVAGLITLKDARAPSIDHALAISLVHARARWYTWPAQRTDGNTPGADVIPEGAHLRLDPQLDVSELGLPPLVAKMARAAQRYGLIVRDQSGAVAFSAELPPANDRGAWSGPEGEYDGMQSYELAKLFPWKHLQVLKSRQRCCDGNVQHTQLRP